MRARQEAGRGLKQPGGIPTLSKFCNSMSSFSLQGDVCGRGKDLVGNMEFYKKHGILLLPVVVGFPDN